MELKQIVKREKAPATRMDMSGSGASIYEPNKVMLYLFSLNASFTANPARMTANACWSRLTAFDEFSR